METVLDRHHGCFPTAREAALNLLRSGLFPTWHSTRGLTSGDGEDELPVADGSNPKKP
jgi:hypothetical protein